MKKIILIILILKLCIVNGHSEGLESNPDYMCGVNVLNYFRKAGYPSWKKMRQVASFENSLSMMNGLPPITNLGVSSFIINAETDVSIIDHLNWTKKGALELSSREMKTRYQENMIKIGQSLKAGNPKSYAKCESIFMSLIKKCGKIKDKKVADKCALSYIQENLKQYNDFYSSFSINIYIKNKPKISEIDKLVIKSIEQDEVKDFNNLIKQRMNYDQDIKKSWYSYINSVIKNNSMKILKLGTLVDENFPKVLKKDGGDIDKFFDTNILYAKDETLIEFIKRAKWDNKNGVNKLLKTASILKRKKLKKFLSSLTELDSKL